MALNDVYRNTLDAPPLAPPRYSLLTVLPTVDEPAVRWEGGYSYISELSGGHGATELEECYEWYWGGKSCTDEVTVDPVVLWATDPCHSTGGSLTRDWSARLRRKLLAHQSYDLAREIASNGFGGTSLQDLGSDDPATAITKLEDALAASLGGVLGTLHTTPGTLAMIAASGAIRLDGARWVTPIGTPVVADAGYADDGGVLGSGERGNIIGTGPMRVRLSPIEVPAPDDLRQFIDPRTNTVDVYAWRLAAVEVDFGCQLQTPTEPPLTDRIYFQANAYVPGQANPG